MADEQLNTDSQAPLEPAGATAGPVGISLSPLLLAVRTPIPGTNPCGSDVSYDEDYLAIKAEIDKLGTVSGHVDQERASELRQMMDATRETVRKADRAEAEKQLEQRGSANFYPAKCRTQVRRAIRFEIDSDRNAFHETTNG